jgi:CRISPR type I-E-associated protein CasA/Cse1
VLTCGDRGRFSYDLGTRPWLPVVTEDGTVEAVGLREMFAAPEDYRLAEDDPLVASALWRLLLAVVHAAVGPVSESRWRRLVSSGQVWPTVVAYLTEHREAFDLFSAERPFFQDARYWDQTDPGADKAIEPNSPANLHPLIYGAGGPVLLDHRSNAAVPVVAADVAARLLLTKQCWSNGQRADGSGYAKDSPLWGGMVVMPVGVTIADTLALQFFPCDRAMLGAPVWDPSGPSGWLGRLTWPTRSALLFPAEDPGGSGEPVVAGCWLAHEGQTIDGVSPPARVGAVTDPMWVRSARVRGSGESARYPRVTVAAERLVWRDLEALLADARSAAFDEGPLAAAPGSASIRTAVERAEALGLASAWVWVVGVDVPRQQRPGALADERFPLTGALFGADAQSAGVARLRSVLIQAEAAAAAARQCVVETHRLTRTSNPKVDSAYRSLMTGRGNDAERSVWWDLNRVFRPTLAAIVTHARDADALAEIGAAWRARCVAAARAGFEAGVRTVPLSMRGIAAVETQRDALETTLRRLP